jgi:hypothetical protein
MIGAFAWAPPIQRCEFAFLAEALGLPKDFSRPAHTGALRTILREAGLAYRVELDEEGWLVARITSGRDVIGLAEVGDFDDALEAGCRALALALLDAYEKHILILPTADPYPMGQTPLQLVLADEPALRQAAGPIAETFHYSDPYEWTDARTRNALLAVGYMLGIRADLSKYYNLDLVEGVLDALHLSYAVDWEAHRTAAVVITYHDMDGKNEVAGFATVTADHRDDAEIRAVALALLMAARNGHIWRPAGRKEPDIFIYDWEHEIEPFGLAHYAIWHMFRHGGHVELDPETAYEVHNAFTLLWELTVARMWPSEFLDADGNPTLPLLRALVDDYAQYPNLPKRSLEQIAMLALDLRFEIMLGKEGTQAIKDMLRLEEQLKQDAQIDDLFAKAKGALVDPTVWLDEGNETAQIISAAEMHVTAQQNGYMVLRRAHPRTSATTSHIVWIYNLMGLPHFAC